jgi:hypothetical protein
MNFEHAKISAVDSNHLLTNSIGQLPDRRIRRYRYRLEALAAIVQEHTNDFLHCCSDPAIGVSSQLINNAATITTTPLLLYCFWLHRIDQVNRTYSRWWILLQFPTIQFVVLVATTTLRSVASMRWYYACTP